MSDFITVHDVEWTSKRHPEGHVMRVQASGIKTLRPYGPDSRTRTRTVIGVGGAYIHVSETEDEILALIAGDSPPLGEGDEGWLRVKVERGNDAQAFIQFQSYDEGVWSMRVPQSELRRG